MIRILQALALLFLLFVLSKNIVYFPAFLRSMVTGHNQAETYQSPGHAFTPLRAYLKNVPVAGYYTDRYNENFWNSDEASRIYQQAQYALAPTLLDVEDCFAHPYIIFECEHELCADAVMEKHNLEYVTMINGKILLARKIKRMP